MVMPTPFFFEMSIMDACHYVGIQVPRFCYHESLSIPGSCRMCLVEYDMPEDEDRDDLGAKLCASCSTPIIEGMDILTASPTVLKARENVLEFLLVNHPLDCPICDQAGECDLQDQYSLYGAKGGRYREAKRSVSDKFLGPVVKTIMTRCIHCTRCVRFISEVAGDYSLGVFGRGIRSEIGGYVPVSMSSELSGNVIDLCPVGALTTKSTSFKVRPWAVKSIESVDTTDGCGANLYIHLDAFGHVARIMPKKNKRINGSWISDRIRLLLQESAGSKSFRQSALSAQTLAKLLSGPERKLLVLSKDIDMKSLTLVDHLRYITGHQISACALSSQAKGTNLYSIGDCFAFDAVGADSWLSDMENPDDDVEDFIDEEESAVEMKLLSATASGLFGRQLGQSQKNSDKAQCIIIFSCHIRVESVVLNTRLRSMYAIEKVQCLHMGSWGLAGFPQIFFRAKLLDCLFFLKGKHLLLSLLAQKSFSPVFIFGNSMLNRFAASCAVQTTVARFFSFRSCLLCADYG